MRRSVRYLLLLAILSACVGIPGTQTGIAPLSPFLTLTPSFTPSGIPLLTEISLPTPTNITYKVAQGDTLIGIAGRFGITLEALLAANPAIQPAMLPIGITLIIPAGIENPGQTTPTPAPISITKENCWPETNGGLWCFVLLKNEFSQTLENLSALFTLLDATGQALASQISFALLNSLPPGQVMPLAVHFPPPVPLDVSVHVQVLTAIRLLQEDARYLPVMFENTLVRVDASGQTAQVSGRVFLTTTGTANTLWVLVSAFDAGGNVVGLRRWVSPSALTEGTPLAFDLLISSLGPGIDRVEFLAEARP
jgi:hypothetical protein